MKAAAFLSVSLILLSRCSTMGASIGVGAGIGSGAGFAASKMAHYNPKGTIVLTVSGALIGGVLAALLHRDPLGPMPILGLGGNPPPLRNAETDVIWVPDSILDGKYVEGHRIWNVKSPAHWLLYPANPDTNEKRGSKIAPKKEKP